RVALGVAGECGWDRPRTQGARHGGVGDVRDPDAVAGAAEDGGVEQDSRWSRRVLPEEELVRLDRAHVDGPDQRGLEAVGAPAVEIETIEGAGERVRHHGHLVQGPDSAQL